MNKKTCDVSQVFLFSWKKYFFDLLTTVFSAAWVAVFLNTFDDLIHH